MCSKHPKYKVHIIKKNFKFIIGDEFVILLEDKYFNKKRYENVFCNRLWPEYVKQRIRSTYAYFGGSVDGKTKNLSLGAHAATVEKPPTTPAGIPSSTS